MYLSNKKFLSGIAALFIVCAFIMTAIAIQAPLNFPKTQFDIKIPENSSLTVTANKLYDNKIISSPFLYKLITVFLGGRHGVSAGDYRFTKVQNIYTVAYRIVKGDQGLPKIRVTIPEGTNSADMALIYLTKLDNFNAPKFYLLAKENEGYLFPDTYFFLSNTKPEQIIKEMRANFDKKIASIKSDITKSGKKLSDIIIMSSIVEEEAIGIQDKRTVAGILWNRLGKEMLLQVDPPFYYITGKTTGVTFDDLKIDSPYNTYKYKGLPKGPISNPGIESIKAAINPLATSYYFYLTGKDGIMRYASTYDGHLRNKNIYLN